MTLEHELESVRKIQERSNEVVSDELIPRFDQMIALFNELLTVMRPLTEWFRILSEPKACGDTGKRAGIPMMDLELDRD